MAAASAVALTLVVVLVDASSAFGAGAWWRVDSGSRPSGLPVGGSGELVLSVENVGVARARGPVVVSDVLPAGLRASGISGRQPVVGGTVGQTEAVSCSLEGLSCEAAGPLAPFDVIEVRIAVEVSAGASSGEINRVSVSGGGTPGVEVARPIVVGGAGGFGVEAFELSAEAEGGGPVVQAGAHPFQVTGSILLDQGADEAPIASLPNAGPAVGARDVVARLPPGLIANPSAGPRCLAWEFTQSLGDGLQDHCSYQAAVGVASVTFDVGAGTQTVAAPIFNIEPEPGEPARFGFFVPGEAVPVFLTTSVRSSEDWGVDLTSSEIPQSSGISGVRLTFWGVTGNALHDDARGWGCLAEARGSVDIYESCTHFEESEPPAFVTLPTSCTSSLAASLEADSWAAPGLFETFPTTEPLAALGGCDRVPFSPSVSTSTSTSSASSPSGFSLDLTFDKEGLTSGASIAQSNLESTTVSLPEGLTIDPSAGVGLGACTQAQFAQVTVDSPAGVGCPEDSRLGTVEVETPLLFTTVYGSLYLATPYENPFSEPGHPGGSMIALYVVAKSRAERGILVKLAGKVSANPTTGRLTVTFAGDPPLQFERFNFHFREGAQAPLITPATCGTYATTAQLTPYSQPEDPLVDTAAFQITSGSEGGACPGAVPPFAPAIRVGTINDAAGVYSPFFVELARSDAMSEISSYSATLPVGVTANLSNIPFCPQADIEAARLRTGQAELQSPSCPAASLIGHTLVGTGVGSVLDYVPGTLYFAGPFHGEPFSVVSVTSAVIGPFDLGTIVIRFGLEINPYTGQVSISPTGSEPIPTIIDGIVTHVRSIKVSIDRPGFTLNPTSCRPQDASSALTSDLSQSASIATAFGIDNCKELSFHEKFTASTSAKTGRRTGASLSVKLSTPGHLGKESNIKLVKVQLPRQLSAQLKTLQQACTATQFKADPAGCPAASIVGHATARTPILPVPLKGPAIFVSNGYEQFPSLMLVLQGYGVTIDLVGATHVSAAGVLSTTFKAVPDEPVGKFSLTLPEGKNPALAAIGNLCKPTRIVHRPRRVEVERKGHTRIIERKTTRIPTKLKMPTTFIAQNGQTVHRDIIIKVAGCHPEHHHKDRRRSRSAATDPRL